MTRHRLTHGCVEDDRVTRPIAQGFLVTTALGSALLLPIALYIVGAVLLERAR